MSTITATTIKALVPEVQVLADSVSELDALQDNHAAALVEAQILIKDLISRVEELEAFRLRMLSEVQAPAVPQQPAPQQPAPQQPAPQQPAPARVPATLTPKQILNRHYAGDAAKRLRQLHPALKGVRVLEDLPNTAWVVSLGDVELFHKLNLKKFVSEAEARPDDFLRFCERSGVKFAEPGSFEPEDDEAGLPPECPF